MRHTYHPVCSLTQQHSYFQFLETASVRLMPTPDTADKMRRAGLLLKVTDNGLVLLRALTDETPGLARPLPEFLFPLRFAMQPLNPYFWNFTSLPEQLAPSQRSQKSAIHYFRVGAAAPDGTLILTMQDARSLPLTPLTVSVAVPAPVREDKAIEIRDLGRDRRLPASMLQQNATGLSIDLRPWGAGHYQLQCPGQELLLDCYADDHLHAMQAWAVLEIDQAALEVGPLSIRFAFEARRTRWRYLLRYRPGKDPTVTRPETVSIKVKVAKDGLMTPVSFTSPEQYPTTAPAADLVFESGEALALAERPAHACTLHYTLHGTPMAMVLPAAQGEVLCRPAVPATDPPGSAFSEIIVLL